VIKNLRILIIATVIKVLRKLEPFLKKTFHLNSFDKGLFCRFLLKNIFSNHDRRLNLTKRRNSKKFLFKKKYTSDELVDKFFLLNSEILYPKSEILVVYIGDSLIEYLSRVKININSYENSIAFWLGPKTRLGLNLESELSDLVKSISKFVHEYSKGKSFNDLIIVWSSGSIDLRCSIYELKLRKLFANDDELAQIYKSSTQNLIQFLIKPLSYELSTQNVVFLSELDSCLEGDKPTSIAALKKIKKLNQYPTLGGPKERLQWRILLNKISSEIALENNFKFLNLNKYLPSGLDKTQIQFDGVHISDPYTISNINKKILDLF